LCSHPGFYGKKGQRHFHFKRNQYFKPCINLDKLWTLVPEEARKNSTKDKAAVIDVTQAVSLSSNLLITGLLQGPRKGRAPQGLRTRQSQGVL
jgi:ribosomal protein L15